jgi:hypothetical protein
VESVSALFDRLGINPDFSKIPPATLARAKFVGDETHDCLEDCQYKHTDEDVQGCLNSFVSWYNGTNYVITSTEKSICSKINGVWVSGRLDVEVKFGQDRKAVIEYKTTYKIYETAKLQLAFYCLMTGKQGLILRLKKDGSEPEIYTVEDRYIELAKKLVKATPQEAQKLIENKVEISGSLASQYARCKQEQNALKLLEEELKEQIITELNGERGVIETDDIIYTFTKSKDSERKSWDTKKLEAYLANKSDEYKKVSKIKGTYKVTTKEKKS